MLHEAVECVNTRPAPLRPTGAGGGDRRQRSAYRHDRSARVPGAGGDEGRYWAHAERTALLVALVGRTHAVVVARRSRAGTGDGARVRRRPVPTACRGHLLLRAVLHLSARTAGPRGQRPGASRREPARGSGEQSVRCAAALRGGGTRRSDERHQRPDDWDLDSGTGQHHRPDVVGLGHDGRATAGTEPSLGHGLQACIPCTASWWTS